MDFSNRETQPHTPVAEAPAAHINVVNKKRPSGDPDGMGRGLRLATVILLFAITILLVAIAFSIYFSGNGEADYVQSSDFQAIDISSGGANGSSNQIYFGNIKTMNDKYVVLDNVYYYYIPATTSATANITLQPLVCQVGVPFSQMIINRSSVNWWENLQGSGKVATAITNYQKSNPKGPNCSTTTSSTSSTTSSTTTPATTTPATTTPATTTPATTTPATTTPATTTPATTATKP